MYEKIPIFENREVKENYASHVASILGSDSFWNIVGAGLTRGLIVNPKNISQIKNNGCGATERVYILGIPEEKNKDVKGIRGIGISAWPDLKGSDYYKALVEELGYEVSQPDNTLGLFHLEKHLDTTEELVDQLKLLETLVKQ